MKICKQCNNNFTKKEHRGRQFYCSPKCTYAAKLRDSRKNYKGAAYYREYRIKKDVTLSTHKDKIKMPKSNYDSNLKFDWEMIDKLTNRGNEYG